MLVASGVIRYTKEGFSIIENSNRGVLISEQTLEEAKLTVMQIYRDYRNRDRLVVTFKAEGEDVVYNVEVNQGYYREEKRRRVGRSIFPMVKDG